MNRLSTLTITLLLLSPVSPASHADAPAPPALQLDWKDNWLTIRGPTIPGGPIRVHYLEAYCRPGSTDRKWEQTVIGHKTRLVSADDDGRHLVLESTLADGAVVRHDIRAGTDEVTFELTATNPTDKPSDVHWAQPCVRLGPFTGGDERSYLPKCFIFLDGKLARMPTRDWATRALYTPGQVWCPRGVDRNDVNPRPLSPNVPDNGLIGCYSADDRTIFATAFEPYQELFQGVAACLHSDFRIGGLRPGETKKIRGKIYLVPADVDALLKRYRTDFPEYFRQAGSKTGGGSAGGGTLKRRDAMIGLRHLSCTLADGFSALEGEYRVSQGAPDRCCHSGMRLRQFFRSNNTRIGHR